MKTPAFGLLMVVLTACSSSTPVIAHTPAATGVVVGGVHPCQGVVVPGGPRYAAATVTVLKGTVAWSSSGRLLLPSEVVAQQTVAENQTYRFELAPGPYVLRASFPPPANVAPFTPVTVRAGQTVTADIPNLCK